MDMVHYFYAYLQLPERVPKTTFMRGSKLLLSFAVAGLFIFSSCTSDKLDDEVLSATNLPMSGLQEVPQRLTSGNGSMDFVYNRDSRTLSYTVRWNSLTGPVVQAHIHGTAQKGVNAGILQDWTTPIPKAVSGTYSGSVLIDGVVFREEDLLLGRYYVNIHTAMYPGGEIRGQIENLK
jgi:CHRD domain